MDDSEHMTDTGIRDERSDHGLWPWFLAGAAYGLFLRYVFGILPDSVSVNGVMSIAFLFGAPLVAGAMTVHGARHSRPSLLFAVFGPWLTVLMLLLGSLITLLEGFICIALLAPLFFGVGSLGGIAMWIAQKLSSRHGANLGAFVLLPVALLAGEEQMPLDERLLTERQSVVIEAGAERVWNEIMEARDIRPDELPFSVTHLIGVPRPVEGVNRQTPDGEIRFSRWERGVQFQGIVTDRVEHETIHWEYAFDAHSFPPGSMDEHVAIGGRFFDLVDTRFVLHAISADSTELEIIANYRVSSSINLYAVPAARFLGRDFVATILGLYKGRSEAPGRE